MAVSAVAALGLGAGGAPASVQGPTGRGRELVHYECSSLRAGRALTLFANGTLRLRRHGAEGVPETNLVELGGQELDDVTARFSLEVEAGQAESARGGVRGEGVEQCLLRIELPPAAAEEFRFSGLEAVSLALARRIAIAEELYDLALSRRRGSGFPPGYEPRAGDLLLRADGERFRIVRFTADGRGVEIAGVEQPLVLYVEALQVSSEFAALLERRDGR